ncbi:DNA-3-methyladenine glycosylase I [Lentilactobacillus sp. Marseille-Q4993]|uniref:DNA-3-methyladenine glycosylase I n=1 Tax=Lentilactobacillus sp. Marseille-Q4993 TaxID=3039492 RepID=UPI0024BC07F3|nr:DNA-3-methyladenine glycosylase I [Lentilactobacillus sp. Marseille-Q4993]
MKRCDWATKSPELMVYHDTVWGKPEKSEDKEFIALCLEIMQAGLTFQTVLKFADGMNEVFHGFDPEFLANCNENQIDNFLTDSRIIRNRAKVEAIVANAKLVWQKPELLTDLTWKRTNFETIDHLLKDTAAPVNFTEFVSPYLKEFKASGFKRVGKTTLYSYLQAIGVVNDHIIDCEFR